MLLPAVVAAMYGTLKRSGFDPCRCKPLVIGTVILATVVAKPTKFVDHVKEAVKYAKQDQSLVTEGVGVNLCVGGGGKTPIKSISKLLLDPWGICSTRLFSRVWVPGGKHTVFG